MAVASKQKPVGVGGAGSLTGPLAPGVRWAAPDGHPFMAWAQRAAILNGAAYPAAAKLYLNWQLSEPVQASAFGGWPVRTDVAPAGGLEPIWEYPNANLDGFPEFMNDRAEAERWKQTFALYFGEVQGPAVAGLARIPPRHLMPRDKPWPVQPADRRRFPLGQAAQAHIRLADRTVEGELLLQV